MRLPLACSALLLGACAPVRTADSVPAWPRAAVLPQPDDQVSFEVDGREVLRYHYGPQTPKPYFFPVLEPSGRSVTRLTHPHDPVTHSHHLSLWVGHRDVGGVNFWEVRPGGARIVHDRIITLDDGERASLAVRARWLNDEGMPLLLDQRVWTLRPRYETIGPSGFGEYFLDLELTLMPTAARVVLGKSDFGVLAVRVAKTMGVADGGGTVTNSEGRLNAIPVG